MNEQWGKELNLKTVLNSYITGYDQVISGHMSRHTPVAMADTRVYLAK